MLFVSLILIGVAIVLLVFYLREKIKAYTLKEVFLKAIISLLFVSVGVYNYIVNKENHYLKIFIIIGLIFGLSGDVFLDLKYVYRDKENLFTYLGFVVFALGHICFIIAMISTVSFSVPVLYIIIPILISMIIGAGILVLAKPLKLDFKDKKVIVLLYSLCLFNTPLIAISLSIYLGFASNFLIMMAIGGVLFAASDLILSQTYFGEGHEKPIDFILNYLTYYSAQFVIAMSLFI